MKSLAAAFLLSTLCVRIFAASPASSPSAIVDKLVERDMHRYGIVGVSVGVRSGDAVVHEKAYGLANIELAVAARPDTVYQLSSTTKIMTGTALLALFTAKGLSLDSPAASFLPELPETWRTVTVRQLVSHLSGLPDVTEIDVTSAEEAITILGSKPVEAPPGERWRYNQTNYMLVRRIIERLSGTTFENYVAEKIFRPAGMRSSVFAGSLFDVVAGRATSYQGENGVLRLRDFRFPRYNSGAAGLNSNVPDLLRFDAALRAGRILPAEAVALLWQPARLANGSETHY
ncbi:MAG TPA: serine hydrolase domain-containing protein, partial [Thermoanaerobaculia bacterium]